LPWLQNPSQTSGYNINNVRRETSRAFRNKKEGTCERKNELETYSKNKKGSDLYRSINEYKKGYQPKSNLVKGET